MPQADGATAQAQDKAHEVAGQAKEQAQQAAGQAKSQLRSQVDQRSTQAGQQISSQASDVRTIADQLREQGKDKPAQLAEKAAQRVEGLGSYLENSDADRILHDVEDFARQRPWAVIAGGVALGLAASRFLKASSSDRYVTRSSSGQIPARQGRYSYGTGYGTGTTGYGTTPAVPPTGAGYGNELATGVGGGVPRTDPPAVPATPPTTAPTTGGF